MRIPIVASTLVLAVLAIPCFGQEITGNIEGILKDAEGKPVPFANIVVSSPELQGDRGVMSTSEGYFGIFKLPVGKYRVKISHVSYQPVTREGVLVHLGRTTTLRDIALQIRIHETQEIIVEEKRQLIDVTSTTIGSNLAPEDFEALPIQRDYRELPNLLPQANVSFYGDETNFAGGTGLENKYFIDGVDVTDPYRGTTGMKLPYNFIREVEVKAGSYEAEYRSSLGGILNVITHSGRNQFYGQVFGFYANNRFAGDPRVGAFEPATGDFAQYDIGLSLGGPISRDKLWFYLAYNPTVEKEDVDIPGQGYFPDESIQHIFAGKLTWRASKRVNVGFSIFGDPGTRDGVGVTLGNIGVPTSLENPDPYLVDMKTGGVAGSIYADWLSSDRLFFESMVSLNTRRDYYQGATDRARNEPLFIDEETGTWSGGYIGPTDDVSTQASAFLKGTLLLGNHAVKAGIEYKDLRTDVDEFWSVLIRQSDTSYMSITRDVEGTVGTRIPSVFVQDSWRVTQRLRLNLGIRWDGQYLIDSNRNTAQRINDQYQPRVGFVVQPFELGKHKIVGSLARYYQDMSTYMSSLYHIEGATVAFVAYDHDPRTDPSGGFGFVTPSEIQPEVDGLNGQHYDEVMLGYELQLRSHLKAGVTGLYRRLRDGIEDATRQSDDEFVYGNPGAGDLTDYPKFWRIYRGLVFSVEQSGAEHFNFLASYVLSEAKGNYNGLFNNDFNYAFPNANGTFDHLENTIDGEGLLPNDRTHVLKFYGSYRTGVGLTLGSTFFLATGTPRSIFEGSNAGPPSWNFMEPRGTDGRTPTLWDLNFRIAYDLPWHATSSWRSRLLLDIFHIGSQREAVAYEQIKYFDTQQQVPNPDYGAGLRYQPPTAMRLGLELDF